jgi:hypothetical protein
MAPKIPAATAAKAPMPRAVLTWTAMEPAPEPDSTAWMPKVVPVTTWPLTVVVTVAGTGSSVVLEQPDQVPVHDEKGPLLQSVKDPIR